MSSWNRVRPIGDGQLKLAMAAAVRLALVMSVIAAGACGGAADLPAAAFPTAQVTTPLAPPTPAITPAPSPAPTLAVIPTTKPIPLPVGPVRTGAGVLVDRDFAPLHGQRVGVIAHHASTVDGARLIDLIAADPRIELTAVFAPEHGLLGTIGAGDAVASVLDRATGVPVYSLYGETRSPTPATLANIDVLVYDLQDVGSRSYTYISTLGLAMAAAADADVAFMVLDRPNPLSGTALAGPTLDAGLESFIGLYPVPSVYGLTAGELATMIKNESMLPGLEAMDLSVVRMDNWQRSTRWSDTGLDWVAPSPNLATFDAALVYPGTVLFEATSISEGRGTDEPFQLVGAPWIDGTALASTMNARGLVGVRFEPSTFTPGSIAGVAPNPRYEGQTLGGVHIVITDRQLVAGVELGLHLLDAIMDQAQGSGRDRGTIIDQVDLFDRLAGSTSVRSALIGDTEVVEIIASFEADHAAFRDRSATSLLYGN